MTRSIVTSTVAAALGATLVLGAHAPVQAAPAPSSKCKAAATLAKGKTVSGKRLGACVGKAFKSAGTMRSRTVYPGVVSGTTDYRFGSKADLTTRASDGGRVVILGSQMWLKDGADSEWVRGRSDGTRAEQDAYLALRELRLGASPGAWKREFSFFAASWRATGRTKRIDGVKVREYRSKPRTSRLEPGDSVKQRIWIDAKARVRHSTFTMVIGGEKATARQSFSRFGKKVTITLPAAANPAPAPAPARDAFASLTAAAVSSAVLAR